jgi:uncharacterized protein (TIRG00374 family)
MKRKHAITTATVLFILVTLVYIQFRTWRSFEWGKFWEYTKEVNFAMIGVGVALIYFAYLLRAIRWKIFLRPTKQTTVARMLPPQIVGFTGLALLGRPGEFVRPYLIARREGLTFSSQLAVWFVERVFDMSSVAVLMGTLLAMHGGKYHAYPWVAKVGFGVLTAAAVFSGLVFSLWWKYEPISSVIEKIARKVIPRFATTICHKVHSFGQGLHTIHDLRSFVAVAVISLTMWIAIGQAYLSVVHAYPEKVVTVASDDPDAPPRTATVRLKHMRMEDVMLMMGASMVGSMVQLPGVGGGSQLAVIKLLSTDLFSQEPYNIPHEMATSCGIMLWLVTFMAVIPAGLILARFEHVSLRAVAEESETEAESDVEADTTAGA